MKICRVVGMVAIVLSAHVSSAFADDRWFVGIEGGRTSATGVSTEELGKFYFGSTPLTSPSSSFGHDTGWSVLGGYAISPYFSVQATYMDLGASTVRYNATSSFGTGTLQPVTLTTVNSVTASLKNTGLGVMVSARQPIKDSFDVHGQLGVLRVSTKLASALIVGTGFQYSTSGSSESNNGVVGLGAGYRVGKAWTLAIDWRRIFGVGSAEETIKADYDFVSLGARVSF